MKYAYLDKAQVLHVVESRETAEQFSNFGRIIETDIDAKFGYPTNKDGKGVIVYSPEHMKLDAKGKDIEPITELAELYKKCMG